MPEHFSTYIFYQGSFVLPGENRSTVQAISSPPNAVGSLGILPLKAGENPVLDKVPSVFQSSGLTSDCPPDWLFSFPWLFDLGFILSLLRALCFSGWTDHLDYWLWFIPFLLFYYDLLVLTAPMALEKEFSPLKTEDTSAPWFFWVELRGSSNLIWMWFWTTSFEDPFAW